MPHDTRYAPGTARRPTDDDCGCGCGGCTGCDTLQCLCRPRFFAGQLVTDADFRRLDDYLVAKDRLHNRYLNGTGVVCGLEVVCNPCDDTVTVRTGYALGPCGEDIVVCSDTRVDVAALIREQRRAGARKADCGPYTNPPYADCDAAQQRWILGICYDEQPARPVTTLTSSGGNGSCGCSGGSATASSGGCGCGTATMRPGPVRCEPTVICEGFRFTLTKDTATVTDRRGAAPQSALAARVKTCLDSITSRLSTLPSDPSPADLVAYCCTIKAELGDLIATSAIHDCGLDQRLGAITCPDPNDRNAAEKARQAITAILAVAVDVYRECLCSALLPPCPDSCAEDCVPLATLTVRSSDLQVLDVCNWSSRKFAVTLPTLGYWLGWLPFTSTLRQLVSRLCCPPSRAANFQLDDKLHVSPASVHRPQAAPPQAAAAAGAAKGGGADLPDSWQVAIQYAESSSVLSGLEATFLQGLGASDPQGGPVASDAELAAPFAALALARFAGPAGARLALPLGEPMLDLWKRSTGRAEPPDDDRLAALEKAVDALQKRVASQARTITALRKRGTDR